MRIELMEVGDMKLELTTRSPRSSYGIPVLRATSSNYEGHLGPRDEISGVSGAYAVLKAMRLKRRSVAEQDAVRLFLSQWPTGPQFVGQFNTIDEAHGQLKIDVGFDPFLHGGLTVRGRHFKELSNLALFEAGYIVLIETTEERKDA